MTETFFVKVKRKHEDDVPSTLLVHSIKRHKVFRFDLHKDITSSLENISLEDTFDVYVLQERTQRPEKRKSEFEEPPTKLLKTIDSSSIYFCPGNLGSVELDDFDTDIEFLDDQFSDSCNSYETEDSNAENHYANDYPDEEDEFSEESFY